MHKGFTETEDFLLEVKIAGKRNDKDWRIKKQSINKQQESENISINTVRDSTLFPS